MSDDVAQVERLLRQLELDREKSSYWRARWAEDDTDQAIESWLRSLLDWLEPPLYALPAVRPAETAPLCGCATCDGQRRALLPWPERLSGFMILCPFCGNKRCPRANWHGNDCTGSNEPGQPGSGYPSVAASSPAPSGLQEPTK